MDDNKISCLICSKRSNSLLSVLNNEELKILDKDRYIVSYKSGEIICKEGHKPLGLICLNKGKVKMVRTGLKGIEQIIGLKKPFDFIELRALMVGNPCLSSSVALEDSTICVIDKKEFFKLVENNKRLAFKIIRLFALDLIKSDNHFVSITQKHIRARLAEALLIINNIYGTNPRTGMLNVSLKRSDLAGIANMTTSNAIRILSSFNKEQLVDVNRRDIKIINFEKLKKISLFDQ